MGVATVTKGSASRPLNNYRKIQVLKITKYITDNEGWDRVNNAWEEYVSFWQRGRFVKLTAEELRIACPHLSDFNFELMTSYTVVTLALPPIKVRGSFRVAVLNRAGHDYQLQWFSNTNRVKNFAFASDAVAYAEQAWPEHLIEDSWVDVQHIQLCDPTRLDAFNNPTQVTTLYVTLLRSWEEIEESVGQPLYQYWDNAIQYITTNPLEGGEYAGWQHKVHIRYNCSFCGGGLTANTCSGCSSSYRTIQNGWNVPLTPRLAGFLQSQHHSFGLHPSRLWK